MIRTIAQTNHPLDFDKLVNEFINRKDIIVKSISFSNIATQNYLHFIAHVDYENIKE